MTCHSIHLAVIQIIWYFWPLWHILYSFHRVIFVSRTHIYLWPSVYACTSMSVRVFLFMNIPWILGHAINNLRKMHMHKLHLIKRRTKHIWYVDLSFDKRTSSNTHLHLLLYSERSLFLRAILVVDEGSEWVGGWCWGESQGGVSYTLFAFVEYYSMFKDPSKCNYQQQTRSAFHLVMHIKINTLEIALAADAN